MPRSRETPALRAAAPAAVVALVTDRVDWHARALVSAFAALGARARPVMLPACAIETGTASGLALAGFGGRLPDAVLVRSMAGGSFEAVTLRLGILHALRELGVPVWN